MAGRDFFWLAVGIDDDKKVRIVWFTVRLPAISLFRLPGPADNCWNVSRRRFELTQKITAQFQIRVLF
jgi:hypothetical protein